MEYSEENLKYMQMKILIINYGRARKKLKLSKLHWFDLWYWGKL